MTDSLCDTDNRSTEHDGIRIKKNWMAVEGDRIVAKADTKDRAARAANYLGRDFSEVIATPKNGVLNFI